MTNIEMAVSLGSFHKRYIARPIKVAGSLTSVAVALLNEHLRHCVTGAARSDDAAEADRIVAEATRAIERLVRS